MYAARNGHADIVELLLRYGAKVPLELQGKDIIKAALTLIAEERAEARVVGHELLNQQQAMPPEIVKLCCSYVSAQSLDQKEFVSAAELRAEQADVGIDDEKQQSTCEQIMTNCVIS